MCARIQWEALSHATITDENNLVHVTVYTIVNWQIWFMQLK